MQDNQQKQHPTYIKATLLIIGTFFFFAGIYYARGILIPLAVSGLLAILLLPLVSRLENWIIPRVISILISLLLLLGILIAIFMLLSSQVISFSNDIPKFLNRFNMRILEIFDFIETKTSISQAQQLDWLQVQMNSFAETGVNMFTNTFIATTTTIAMIALIPIYIFFLLYYREKVSRFFYQIFPGSSDQVADVLLKVKGVIQGYISGVAMVVAILAVLNTTGLFLLGIP
jgi:putative heme transporter